VTKVPPWAQALVGRTVGGRYRLEHLAGSGGIGAVFRSLDLSRERLVAVKLLVPRLVDAERAAERFRREAAVAAQAAGRGVTQVLDFDVDPACGPFLVFEYLEGESLAARLRRQKRLPPAEAVSLARGVLDTLAAVHAQGVVHRDLKPANIFFSHEPDGRALVTVLDFGLARLIPPERQTVLAGPGAVIGTPAYMPPEQARGTPEIDLRSDLYALGAILYVCLAGRRPYEGSRARILAALLKRPPRSLRLAARGLPPALYLVIERAMARERDERFPSARAMGDALAPVLGLLARR
jgi:serine/threonine protein kinase